MSRPRCLATWLPALRAAVLKSAAPAAARSPARKTRRARRVQCSPRRRASGASGHLGSSCPGLPAMQDSRDRSGALQADAVLAEPHAFSLEHIKRTAEMRIRGRRNGVAGLFPTEDGVA